MARKTTAAKAGASKADTALARNSTLDLARMSVREVNQLLHDADGGDFLHREPARGCTTSPPGSTATSTSRSTAMSATTAPA